MDYTSVVGINNGYGTKQSTKGSMEKTMEKYALKIMLLLEGVGMGVGMEYTVFSYSIQTAKCDLGGKCYVVVVVLISCCCGCDQVIDTKRKE